MLCRWRSDPAYSAGWRSGPAHSQLSQPSLLLGWTQSSLRSLKDGGRPCGDNDLLGCSPDVCTFRRQDSEALSRAHSSRLAPYFFTVSHTCSSVISRRSSKLSWSGEISWWRGQGGQLDLEPKRPGIFRPPSSGTQGNLRSLRPGPCGHPVNTAHCANAWLNLGLSPVCHLVRQII